jgi:C-terminal processing protease CtpA/Prc
MRGWIVLSVLAVGAGFAEAAPVPATQPPAPSQNPADAQVFAQQLLAVVNQVVEQYVRPVERKDVLYAALCGLYEAARLPVPDKLRSAIDKANAAGDLTELVLHVRMEVGDAEALQGQHPLVVSCQAMARVLDPYCSLITGEEQRRTLGLGDECDGTGLEVQDHPGPAAEGTKPVPGRVPAAATTTGPLIVRLVHPGGPAQRGGLRPGDRITHLDDQPVEEISRDRVQPLLTTGLPSGPPPVGVEDYFLPPPRPLRVTYRRPEGKETTTVTLERRRFRPETVLGVARRDDNTWDYLVDRERRLAHVRLSALSRGSADELLAVLTRLREDGLSGLILDLRWCPGGFLDEAVAVAGLFLGDGVVATVKSRQKPDVVHRGKGEGAFLDFPIVVLVNGETSGGAELIAAALEDHRRAVVAGQRTLGKGSVQTPLHLGVGPVALKLTSGTFTRPSGKNLHRFPDSTPGDDWGVCPEARLELRVSAELGRTLKQWWLWQTLRPGESMERLPLDDPTADPQRHGALRALMAEVERKGKPRAE